MPHFDRADSMAGIPGAIEISHEASPSADHPNQYSFWGLVAGLCVKHFGWLISASLHTVMAVVLWELVIHEPVAPPLFPMFASVADAPETDHPFDIMPMVELPQTKSESAVDTPSFSELMLSVMDSTPSGTVTLGPIPMAAGNVGKGPGGPGGEGGGPASVGFFGTTGTGSSCVFVVDMSGSMEERGRFARTKQELVRSIAKLKEPQSYYVVFFNQFAFPMFHPKPATELAPATPGMRAKVTRWINKVRPGSFTNPVPALQIALALEPDVIFLLTDGEIPPETVEIVQQLNRKPTVIHTIAFQSRAGEEMLRAIANSSGGVYRYIK